MENKVFITVEARDSATPTLESVKSKVVDSTEEMKRSSESLRAVWENNLGKIAAVSAAAFAGVGLAFKSGVKNAADEQDALNRLRVAIELAGGSWEENRQKVIDFTAALQQQSRFGDTEYMAAMGTIIQLTGDVSKGFQGAKIAADLASTGLFDLSTAARYVAMAMEGEVTMLGRYIPQLKETALQEAGVTTKAERAAYAIDILTQKFGGTAQGAIRTYGGSMDQLKNSLGDLSEAIGDLFLNSLTSLNNSLRPVIESLTEFINKNPELSRAIFVTAGAVTALTAAISALSLAFGALKAAGFLVFFDKIIIAISAIGAQGAALIGLLASVGYAIYKSIESAKGLSDTLTLLEAERMGSLPGVVVYWDAHKKGAEEAAAAAEKARVKFEGVIPPVQELVQRFKPEVIQGFRKPMIELATDAEVAMKSVSEYALDLNVSWSEAVGGMLDYFIDFTYGLEAAWYSAITSMADSSNTWSSSLQNAWRMFKMVALRQIAEVTWAWISGEQAKTAAAVGGFATRMATYIAEGAAAVATAAKYIYQAVAAIFSWAAKIPFVGIAIGAGAVAAMMAIVNQFKTFAEGGLVGDEGKQLGLRVGSDTIPALLTPGEYVMPADRTRDYLPILDAMRAGIAPAGAASSQISIVVQAGAQISIGELVRELIPELERTLQMRRLKLK